MRVPMRAPCCRWLLQQPAQFAVRNRDADAERLRCTDAVGREVRGHAVARIDGAIGAVEYRVLGRPSVRGPPHGEQRDIVRFLVGVHRQRPPGTACRGQSCADRRLHDHPVFRHPHRVPRVMRAERVRCAAAGPLPFVGRISVQRTRHARIGHRRAERAVNIPADRARRGQRDIDLGVRLRVADVQPACSVEQDRRRVVAEHPEPATHLDRLDAAG